MQITPPIVSVEWLQRHITNQNIIILDASPTFDASRTLAGARHFDIKNTFSDVENELPNTFPSQEQFEEEAQKLGINTNSHIVVYDSKGIFTSPRAWFMFRAFGHEQVSVLDGGLPEWILKKFPIQKSKGVTHTRGNFKALLQNKYIKSLQDVLKNQDTQQHMLIDARSAGRFKGIDPEPRPQLKSGNIKNSISLPYTEVLHNGKFKTKSELQELYDDMGLASKPIIFSCGSGITACIILLGYYIVSGKLAAVYDGSWTEWATRNDLFVE